MIVSSPPIDVTCTRIFLRMLEATTSADGLVERTNIFIATASHLADLITSGPFKHYTLHNRDHPKKLIHIAEFVAPPETIKILSSVDCLIFIYASYLHDLGLAITSKERSRIIETLDFAEYIRSWPELWNTLLDARSRLARAEESKRLAIETEIFQLQEAALSQYLRPLHATPDRYRELIKAIKASSGREDLFTYSGISFEDTLIDICASHNLDACVLGELRTAQEERFPRRLPIGGQVLNAQYCAALLRICDILDFDRERTPRILFESLGIESRVTPGSRLTLQEWNKHLSIHTINIESNEIVIYGECEHPTIEKAIKDFCGTIGEEIRNTSAIIKRNTPEISQQYQIIIPSIVRASIRAKGYVYKDFSLHLDENAILRLLMGNELYSEPAVAGRELVQNAIDACILRAGIEKDPAYRPEVTVRSKLDDAGLHWLVVADNGVGMSEYVLEKFFFNIGKSYYNSSEFDRIVRRHDLNTFKPISRFGIGILSTFMIGDSIEVVTKASERVSSDNTRRTIRIERMGALAYVIEDADGECGTEIRARIDATSDSACRLLLNRISHYLRENVVRPRCEVRIDLEGDQYTIRPNQFYSLALRSKQVLNSFGAEVIQIDLGRWSNVVSGVAFLFFSRDDSGKLNHKFDSGKFVQSRGSFVFGGEYVPISELIDGYHGNRVSVNGFRMTFKNPSKLIGDAIRKEFISVVLDMEVCADERVMFDVSRSKLIKTGVLLARAEVRQAILGALDDTGCIDRISDETRAILRHRKWNEHESIVPVTDAVLLKAVEALIPPKPWPQGLHRRIGEELGIPNSLSFRAISTILSRRKSDTE